jgi:uncharacterized membrane protein YkvA (DUF1232 family)
MASNFKITFELDEQDTKYFQDLYRTAKKNAKAEDAPRIMAEVKSLIQRVRSAKRVPNFVRDAITTLEDLMQMLEDKQYQLPRAVAESAVAGLAYFANAQDVIPDHIPALGFLDDAIMISIVADEFKHELWAYRKFRSFSEGAEQRPWTSVAQDRLPKRLEAYRRELREKVEDRKQRDALRAKATGIRKLTL